MANFTKQAIKDAFIKLLNEHPLKQITVRDIVEECGINRNTFYYHYHDIYDLLESLLHLEEKRIVANVATIQTLQQSFEESMRFVLLNRQAVYHVYYSVSRDVLASYLYNVSEICMRCYIENQCEGLDFDEKDLNDLVFLYASMLEGVVINIMREGLTRDVEDLIANAIRMLEGTARMALENSCRR